MIKLSHVSVSFEDGRRGFQAVDDFTYEFGDRGLFFIVGEADAGKSTLLNVIGGLRKPTLGEAVSAKGTTFSYVFQEDGLILSLSLLDNLRLAEPDEGKIKETLALIGLQSKLKVSVARLSKGERILLAVARASLSRASAILLDEPAENCGPADAAKVYELLAQASKERLVIVATRDFGVAKASGGTLLSLQNGKLIEAPQARPLLSDEGLKPAPEDPHIPSSVQWHYAWRMMFLPSVSLFLALFLAGTLLLLAFNSALYDGSATEKAMVEASDPLFFDTSWQKNGDAVKSGKDYSDYLESLGISPTYEVSSYSYFADAGTGKQARLLLADSLDIQGVSYAPADGEAVVSDCLDSVLGTKAGDDLGAFVASLKGLIIGQEAATGYETARAHFPDDTAGDYYYDYLISNSYLFAIINTNTYFSMIEKEGIWMWSPLAEGKPYNDSLARGYLTSQILDSTPLLYGSYPTTADEIVVSDSRARVIGGGDIASAVGKTLNVYPFTHDYYEMSTHFPTLKVSGVLSGSDADAIYASAPFFEALKGDIQYETAKFLLGRAGLKAYVKAGKPQDIVVSPAPSADPLATASGVSQEIGANFRIAFFVMGGLFALLSVWLLTRHSLKRMRQSEGDIAGFQSLEKSNASIAGAYWLMNVLYLTIPLLLSFAAGAGITFWIGAAIQGRLSLPFNPFSNSVWAFLATAALAYALPFLVSLLSQRIIDQTHFATVFKRNLQ